MTEESATADKALMLESWRMMTRIREFETLCMRVRADGAVLGNTFPSTGQEAFVACGLALEAEDVVFPSYRSRPLFFGKGVTVEEHFRELVGSPRSELQGREVFHHAAWPAKGMMPSSSMIGGWVPMAVGYALTQKLDDVRGMTVVTMGDGILGAGDLHEAFNIAGLWDLPILAICENNGYQVSAPWNRMRKHRKLGVYAQLYGFEILEVDGNDPLALHRAVRDVRDRVIGGQPVLIDCFTYRFGGYSSHIGEPRRGHEEELAEWIKRDPIMMLADRIVAAGVRTAAELKALRADEITEIERAWIRVLNETPAEVVA